MIAGCASLQVILNFGVPHPLEVDFSKGAVFNFAGRVFNVPSGSLLQFFELLDANRPVRKDCSNVQFPSHRLDYAS